MTTKSKLIAKMAKRVEMIEWTLFSMRSLFDLYEFLSSFTAINTQICASFISSESLLTISTLWFFASSTLWFKHQMDFVRNNSSVLWYVPLCVQIISSLHLGIRPVGRLPYVGRFLALNTHLNIYLGNRFSWHQVVLTKTTILI